MTSLVIKFSLNQPLWRHNTPPGAFRGSVSNRKGCPISLWLHDASVARQRFFSPEWKEGEGILSSSKKGYEFWYPATYYIREGVESEKSVSWRQCFHMGCRILSSFPIVSLHHYLCSGYAFLRFQVQFLIHVHSAFLLYYIETAEAHMTLWDISIFLKDRKI